MPRAKVRPENRQRSMKACTPCQLSKIRCDAQTPCTSCTRRGKVDACSYASEPSDGSNKRRRLSSNVIHHEEPSRPRDTPQSIISRTGDGEAENGSATTSPSDGNLRQGYNTESPQSRMLLSGKLQKLHVGETASLSYLQFLRQVLKHRMGPCAFTENEFSNFMLESDFQRRGPEPLGGFSVEEKRDLVRCYFDATAGILDLFNKTELMDLMTRSHAPTNNEEIATTSLTIAIGAQCRGAPADLQRAPVYFSRGQALAFEGMLSDPSENMVRFFLLMAFYMLGACRRNTAFMYLGVAATSARALGLHKLEQYRALSTEECRVRLACWKSLRGLDMIVNSILGRSGGLSGMLLDDRSLQAIDDSTPGPDRTRRMAMQATFDIIPFLDELERKSNLDRASAERFLQRLRQWSSALPSELRKNPSSDVLSSLAPPDRELFIGATHVACIYYFAVILVTRPFLTMYLLPQIREGTTTDSAFTPQTYSSPSPNLNAPSTSALAQICLNAALNVAKLGHTTLTQNHLLANMCLLKAWMFAAGLLLGFASFCRTDAETAEAFHQVVAVLRKLAEQSPQAAHYAEILGALWEAVEKERERKGKEWRKGVGRFLDQIFSVDVGEERQSGGEVVSGNREVEEGLGGQGAGNDGNVDPGLSSGSGYAQADAYDDALGGWQDLGASSWDDFSFDLQQPFAPFMDGF